MVLSQPLSRREDAPSPMSGGEVACNEHSQQPHSSPTSLSDDESATVVSPLFQMVDPSIRTTVAQIFTSTQDRRIKLGGKLFLAHLLRLSVVRQLALFPETLPSQVAVLSVPTLRDLCRQARYAWPWCYDTTLKYLNLLIAVGIIVKPPQTRGQGTVLYVPLTPYAPPAEQTARTLEHLSKQRSRVSRSLALQHTLTHASYRAWSSERRVQSMLSIDPAIHETVQAIYTAVLEQQGVALLPATRQAITSLVAAQIVRAYSQNQEALPPTDEVPTTHESQRSPTGRRSTRRDLSLSSQSEQGLRSGTHSVDPSPGQDQKEPLSASSFRRDQREGRGLPSRRPLSRTMPLSERTGLPSEQKPDALALPSLSSIEPRRGLASHTVPFDGRLLPDGSTTFASDERRVLDGSTTFASHGRPGLDGSTTMRTGLLSHSEMGDPCTPALTEISHITSRSSFLQESDFSENPSEPSPAQEQSATSSEEVERALHRLLVHRFGGQGQETRKTEKEYLAFLLSSRYNGDEQKMRHYLKLLADPQTLDYAILDGLIRSRFPDPGKKPDHLGGGWVTSRYQRYHSGQEAIPAIIEAWGNTDYTYDEIAQVLDTIVSWQEQRQGTRTRPFPDEIIVSSDTLYGFWASGGAFGLEERGYLFVAMEDEGLLTCHDYQQRRYQLLEHLLATPPSLSEDACEQELQDYLTYVEHWACTPEQEAVLRADVPDALHHWIKTLTRQINDDCYEVGILMTPLSHRRVIEVRHRDDPAQSWLLYHKRDVLHFARQWKHLVRANHVPDEQSDSVGEDAAHETR